MIYPIVKYGQEVLSRVAEPVKAFDDDLKKLVADMFETMYAAHGVGLAAPQIGISRQVCVIDVSAGEDSDKRLVLVNPEMVSAAGKQSLEEGCLSLPDFRAETSRPLRVTVRARDLTGKEITVSGEGLLARALCHEIDHLHGVLFIQHLSMLKRDSIKRRIRKLMKAGTW